MMLLAEMKLNLNLCDARLWLFLLAMMAFPWASSAQEKYVEEGIASFYHDKFVGRKTANGEIFTQTGMTAAHKSLKLGTWVRVTNLSNNESVVLRINDRMPKSNKRSIDLTYSAAEKLGYIAKGLTRVRIEVIDEPEVALVPLDPGPPALETIRIIDCKSGICRISVEAQLQALTSPQFSEVIPVKKRRF